MEVEQFQEKIVEFCKAWEDYRGLRHTEQNIFNHLIEEIGELARQFVNKDKGRGKFDCEQFDNAIGDILIHLTCLANLRGLKVEKLIEEIIKEDSKRLLKKVNKN